VVADERDVIRLRTNYRGERVYLYRLRVRPEAARALLLDYLQEVNRLAAAPRWTNALTHNCTTAIRYHAQAGALAAAYLQYAWTQPRWVPRPARAAWHLDPFEQPGRKRVVRYLVGSLPSEEGVWRRRQ
jgi:hypothetical protein